MKNKTVVAIMYDFDKTLSPKDMQEYAFIPELGLEPKEFWGKCDELVKKNNMDQILAYMFLMLDEAKAKKLINRDEFKKLGKTVQLCNGVETWFKRINDYGEKRNLEIEHYIISSGLKEIIEGTKIAHEFKGIYAAEYLYNEKNEPVWPALAVNYTSKTQFLFRINKGELDISDNKTVNEFTPEDKRRVPFRNMIYIGDGLTDVPCMKLVKVNGGYSIAVHQDNKSVAERMMRHGRVDFIAPANYSKSSKMENLVFTILEQIAATSKTVKMHLEDIDEMDDMDEVNVWDDLDEVNVWDDMQINLIDR